MGEYFSELFRLALYCVKSILFVGSFTPFFVRREHFIRRNAFFALGGVLFCTLGAGLWVWGQGNMVLEFGIYVILTMTGIVWLPLCFQGDRFKCVFYYFYAMLLQICCRALEGILQIAGILPPIDAAYIPGEETERVLSVLVSFLVSAVFCLCIHAANRRRSRSAFYVQLHVDRSYIVMVLSSSLTTVGLYTLMIQAKDARQTYHLALYALVIACGVSTIYSQHSILLHSQSEQLRQKIEYENQILAQLSRDAFHQYTSLKETMDFLNLRCHDVKHQLHGFVRDGVENAQYFDQLIDTIQVYDCVIKTGNEALDVVLTDAALRCNGAGISFTCLADASLLSGMETADIYSLFGNAVDNAVEYLRTVELDGKFLRIHVEAKGGFTLIRAENYFQGQLLRDAEGALQTTKRERAGHGYGIKSMELIAQKYGGTLTIKAEDHMFQLLILLPRRE